MNSWLEIMESHDLDTHLNLRRDLAGTLVRISKRSSSGRNCCGPMAVRLRRPPSIRRRWCRKPATEGSLVKNKGCRGVWGSAAGNVQWTSAECYC